MENNRYLINLKLSGVNVIVKSDNEENATKEAFEVLKKIEDNNDVIFLNCVVNSINGKSGIDKK